MRFIERTLVLLGVLAVFSTLYVSAAFSAPYAAVVMDARNGKVIYARSANKPLHPASLTKMMTLYIAFSEVEAGRMSLDQRVRISKYAASKPPSKIGLRAGSTIELKYLLRAAAIKSANDASTAIAEAIAGSETAFAVYMSQVAQGIGMKNTRFKNAHGLTAKGHYSTAYDMALLGRRLVYDFPKYYNLFSREYASTPLGNFRNSNIRFLRDYPGADGIKTGYTRAAGYNLVASAKRGRERIIVSMFGGQSSYQRNQQIGALLDLGFQRAPSSVRISNLPRIRLRGPAKVAVAKAKPKPKAQPKPQASNKPPQPSAVVYVPPPRAGVATAQAAPSAPIPTPTQAPPAQLAKLPNAIGAPALRPVSLGGDPVVASASAAPANSGGVEAPTERVVAQGNSGDYAVQLAAKSSANEAEKYLITTSLSELESLGEAKNSVISVSLNGSTQFRPRFSGISKDAAYRTCARIQARDEECYVIAPEYGG